MPTRTCLPLALLAAGTAAASDPVAELKRRQAEAFAAESAAQSYAATVTQVPLRQPNRPAPRPKVTELRVGRRPGHVLIQTGDKLTALNPRYGFVLKRQGDGWVVVRRAAGGGSDPARFKYEELFGTSEAMAARPLTAFTSLESFADALAADGLTAEAVAPPTDYRVRYPTPAADGKAYERVVQCRYAAGGPALLSAVRQSTSAPTVDYRFTRDLDPAGRATKVEEVVVQRGKDEPMQTLRCEFRDYQPTAPPEAEFYLAHYGLPEPDGPAGGAGRWWLVPVVGLLAAAGWLVLRRRR